MAKRIEWNSMTDTAKEIAETILHMLDHRDSFFTECYSKWAVLSKTVTMLQALRNFEGLEYKDQLQVMYWAMDELDVREEEANANV